MFVQPSFISFSFNYHERLFLSLQTGIKTNFHILSYVLYQLPKILK